jgi:hypothetical protein
MANGDTLQVGATVNEIGFPEFTTKLVSDVFDALISANLDQQQAYIELLQATTGALSTYINDTKDDIGPDEILEFLSSVVPPDDPKADKADSEPTKVKAGNTLTTEEIARLNNALTVPAGTFKDENGKDVPNEVTITATETLDPDKVVTIMDAVAIRLAANKYTLLEGMVKQGMLRLVVDGGVITTRLNFRAFSSDRVVGHTTGVHRDTYEFRKKAKAGGFVGLFMTTRRKTRSTSINVSTIDTKSYEASGTTIDIFGEVVINFRTDYLPLDQT